MNKTYVIADTHFGDNSIIKFENRPFRSAEDMDAILIANWNKVVDKNDKVLVLGDFSFYGKEKTTTICKLLNGEKFLIIGNHDEENEKYYYECGFSGVSRYPIIYNDFWMLSHEPIYVNESMPYANIFGHVHSNPIYKDCSSRSFCACVERISYTPIRFSEIQKRIKECN